MVPGEDLGALHELLESHASLADALFEQCPWWPVGQPVLISSLWRMYGVLMAGGGRSADTTLDARVFQLDV